MFIICVDPGSLTPLGLSSQMFIICVDPGSLTPLGLSGSDVGLCEILFYDIHMRWLWVTQTPFQVQICTSKL